MKDEEVKSGKVCKEVRRGLGRHKRHKANIPATKNTVGFAPFPETPFTPLSRLGRETLVSSFSFSLSLSFFLSFFLSIDDRVASSSSSVACFLAPLLRVLLRGVCHFCQDVLRYPLRSYTPLRENSHLPMRCRDGKLEIRLVAIKPFGVCTIS